MRESDEIELLREYAENGSEAAFATLVQRHINLVYSAALRHTNNPHAAEDITQVVFIMLARKARSLPRHTILSGWLYQAARLTAANYLRAEYRRAHREQEASNQMPVSHLPSEPDDAWTRIAPLLDTAVGQLGEKDRCAIVLRFFQNRSLRDVGLALGTTEDAARVRVQRALEKLRSFFNKRGVTVSATLLTGILTANAVTAAPVGLVATVTTIAAQNAPVAGPVLALAKQSLASLAWSKFQLTIALGAVGLVAVGAIATALLPRSPVHPLSPIALEAPAPPVANSEPPAPRTPMVRETITPTMLCTLQSPLGAMALQPDGKILVAATLSGLFIDEQSGMLGFFGRGAMRLESDGSLDRTFYCDVGNFEVSSAMAARVSLLPDGKIFLSGTFDTVDGKPRHGHARLFPDGRLDESFDPWAETNHVSSRIDAPRLAYSSVVFDDGSIAVLSRPIEPSVMSAMSWAAYRLDANGRIISPALTNSPLDAGRPPRLILSYSDMPWGPFPEVPLEFIRYAIRLPDGGAILAVPDRPIASIMRYASLKRFDKNWRPDPGFECHFAIHAQSEISLHLQKDGKLLVAGMVGQFNGEDFPGLVRLQTNGTIDRTFRCETQNDLAGRIMDVKIQEAGQILICGFFTKVNGVECQHLARLNPDGTLDRTFRPPFVSQQEFNRQRFVRVQRLSQASAARTPNPGAPPAPLLETVLIQSLSWEGPDAVLSFTGKPHQLYILQAKESMDSAPWTNVSTNQTNPGGAGTLRDLQAKDRPIRFYRIARP